MLEKQAVSQPHLLAFNRATCVMLLISFVAGPVLLLVLLLEKDILNAAAMGMMLGRWVGLVAVAWVLAAVIGSVSGGSNRVYSWVFCLALIFGIGRLWQVPARVKTPDAAQVQQMRESHRAVAADLERMMAGEDASDYEANPKRMQNDARAALEQTRFPTEAAERLRRQLLTVQTEFQALDHRVGGDFEQIAVLMDLYALVRLDADQRNVEVQRCNSEVPEIQQRMDKVAALQRQVLALFEQLNLHNPAYVTEALKQLRPSVVAYQELLRSISRGMQLGCDCGRFLTQHERQWVVAADGSLVFESSELQNPWDELLDQHAESQGAVQRASETYTKLFVALGAQESGK